MKSFLLLTASLLACTTAYTVNSFSNTLKTLTLTQNQKVYYKSLKDDQAPIVVCNGPAGSGKTFLSVLHALNEVKNKRKESIILTRPTVLVDADHFGALPGNINEKMTPLLQHITNIIGNEHGCVASLFNILKDRKIEVIPLEYIRGHTFNNQIIIADEMQNATKGQFKALLTRMGNNSKMMVIGDTDQSDLLGENGLQTFLTKYKGYTETHAVESIKIVELGEVDIMRSELVKQVLRVYDS